MKFTAGEGRREDGDKTAVHNALKPAAEGLGLSLIELDLFKSRGNVQIRLVVYKKGISLNDCSAFHRAVLPLLELLFPGGDFSVEVSTPGIDRLIKEGAEFAHYAGRGVRCYRADISGWSEGILESADEHGITLKSGDQTVRIAMENISRAKLDHSLE
jgi:ribosome maturation factor RimP